MRPPGNIGRHTNSQLSERKRQACSMTLLEMSTWRQVCIIQVQLLSMSRSHLLLLLLCTQQLLLHVHLSAALEALAAM
jgi:hypothetical protein